MPNGISVGAEVTPEFNDRIERIHENREEDNSKSQTVRHLLREGAKQYEEESFAQTLFKHVAIAFALVALIGYVWANQTGYSQPVYVGVVWMIPSVGSLWLRELWPGITQKLGIGTATTSQA